MEHQHELIYVPEGITFGRKVALIPSVLIAFSHSGSVGVQYKNTYNWIDRGRKLGWYRIDVNKSNVPILKLFAGTETQSTAIPSPVSGLSICPNVDFSMSDVLATLLWHDEPEARYAEYMTAILLPDDEPEAENGNYMFKDVCRLCTDNKEYFLKPSRYRTQGAWSLEDFDEQIGKQLSLQCKYVDALPSFKDCFDEIRKRHPNLRPYIKHLA